MPLAAGMLRTLIATPAAHKHPGCLVSPFLLHRFSVFFSRPGVPHPPRQAPEKGYTPTELFWWLCWVGRGPNDGVNVMPYEATYPPLSLFLSSVKAGKGLWTTPLDSDQGRRARRHATCLAARTSTHEVPAVDFDDVLSPLGDPAT